MGEPQKPTDAEIDILKVLWDRGPSTVREVLQSLDREETAYTTVLKLLQIMREKSLVTRDESSRAHVYAAAIEQERAERTLLQELMDRVFEGSAQRLVLRAIDTEEISPAEREEIKQILENYSEKDDA